ncbi:YicC/YloC family endoribonuclease [Agrobacterium tumefaciens]|uniref:YicC/YloC family endoribonuclease n=1 Tax=Agrobacterium tumefaciens TaxID=358 RepID=UPI000DD3EA92|nr:YicC/YloC family endoribonuclease [Agrobacterium tumefaciens]MCW8056239.1 YicC family protein [Agrobacterium tumefaciens]MCW8144633.1 YicC family protein [Agrobacterium tumefaciens]MQB37034.1 YicC family protein [Agrobacterium tumefaciens]NTA47461.1 YicC family protein [Agrobacterium tumefaciens]QAA97168.1 YicC family protein [Agrobacterium tumefaciens]
MTLQSMTGFARSEGTSGRYRWAWELRSVNGKGLDVRLRLPTGLEALESALREIAGEHLSRGNIQAGLTLAIAENRLEAVINRDALAAVLALKKELGDVVEDKPLSFDTLLTLRGLVDFREAEDDAEAQTTRNSDVLAGFAVAVEKLKDMREREGASLFAILSGHINRIKQLVDIIENDPSRQPEQIAARLAQQISLIGDGLHGLDRDRLHAEAALIATKADLREEIDRLHAHVQASRELLTNGGPVGRKLDFLAQEFNRESNTICSKSNASAVTAAGIELKVVIDQFREQVQNLE